MKKVKKLVNSVCAVMIAAVFIFPGSISGIKHVMAIAEGILSETVGGTYENLNWSIEEGVLTISGEGEMYQNGNLSSGSSYPWYNKSFASVIIENGVTSIGDYAFSGYTELQSVVIAKSVETIGEYAFYRSNIHSAEIPEGVVSIRKSAFSSTDITSITLPKSIVTLESNVFSSCTALRHVEMKTDVEILPAKTFYNCTSLTSCILPDTLIEIKNEAFANTDITDIILPDALLKIEAKAFDTAVTMNNVTIPDSVTAIQDNSFTNIKSITLGANTVIKTTYSEIDDASPVNPTYMRNSERLDDIFVSPDNPYYTAVDGILYDKDQTCILDFAPTHIFEEDTYILPDTLQSICSDRDPIIHNNIKHFAVSQENEYFTTIDGVLISKDGNTLVLYPYARETMIYTVPNGIEVIGESAFYKSKISHVILPNTVISVEKNAFKQSSIKRFDATLNLSYIGDSAFSYCDILYIDLPVLSGATGDEVFNIDRIKAIHLPAGSEFDLGDNMVSVTYGDETNGEVTATGTHGNFTWEIANNTLSIIGNGAMKTCTYNEYPWYGLDFQFLKFSGENICIPNGAFCNAENLCTAELEGVVSIETEAFKQCSSLVRVTKGNSIEYIGDYAFLNTSWISEPVHHYRNDEASGLCVLGSVVLYCDEQAESVCIPEWVTYIARDAFKFCSSLNTLYISKKGFKCSVDTFSYCSGIEHFRYIGSNNDITLKELQKIGCDLENAELTGSTGEIINGKIVYNSNVVLNTVNMLSNTVYVNNLRKEYCHNIIEETGCNKEMTDEELVRIFHEYLMDTTHYAFTYTEDTNGEYNGVGTLWSLNTLFSHKASGLAIVQSGVCSSYSELFIEYAAVLAEYGISTTITALETFGANHQWNVIGLDTGTENERWYYHDASNGQCLIGYENDVLKANPEMFAYDPDIPENADGTYTIMLKEGVSVNLQGKDAVGDMLTGDVDGNGNVDISDAALVLKVYAQNAAGFVADTDNSDIDGDGVITIEDAMAILTYYAMNAAGITV